MHYNLGAEQFLFSQLTKDSSEFNFWIPGEVAEHFLERAKNPCKISQELFNKYVTASPGYRYHIRKAIFYSYMGLNYETDRKNKKQMEQLEAFNQAVAMVVARHMTVIDTLGHKFAYITDINDVKMVEGWKDLFDIMGSDYSHFRKGKFHKLGEILTSMYGCLNSEIRDGKYPDTGLQIPSPQEFLDFMNNEKTEQKPPDEDTL
ncbi:hypothetical protein TVAG_065850 [Trichomonas vaginalis G3]|uniref:Uncharacterized protein n=2 Tax=Trichomonas vaginalis (strain ATCC PRA-98 / G3) TaxID=412133 RepID=A2ELY9_TRIV3|nr:hypothetical protein TVAG_065850 [Trichomonas vaginalis G3]|eukprot:XP_001318551.1 hypothetical protein [Trichomonas vaginalis G3]